MSVHLMCHMPFLTPSERRFLEGVSELAYCNPFTPRRIECERRVLGADFVEGEAVWSLDVSDPYKPLVNGWKVYDRTEGMIQDLRGRLAGLRGQARRIWRCMRTRRSMCSITGI